MHSRGSHAHAHNPVFCCIMPPDLLQRVAEQGDETTRDAALKALTMAAAARARRQALGAVTKQLGLSIASLAFTSPQPNRHNTVYDAQHTIDLPGLEKYSDGAGDDSDPAVRQAYDGAETTYNFFNDVYSRDSIDGMGLELVSSVHYDQNVDNAFWDGGQMIYGDGGGGLLAAGSLTAALDVAGHELTHGVTQHTANLVYEFQPGALNESFSDVFGSLVKQYSLGQTVDQADWLIGAGILDAALQGNALRSMKEPGQANAFDQQVAHMDAFLDLPNTPAGDNGGVHLNSGIPNKAFYLAAMEIGGNAWETAGRIWYDVLSGHLSEQSQFDECANATVEVASSYGNGVQDAVESAWKEVGVL